MTASERASADLGGAAWVMVKGNPVDGFEFVGPYDSHDAAVEDGDEVTSDWWVAPLEAPEGEPELSAEAAKIRAPQHEPEWGED